jgi:uncharacterized protein
MEYMYSVLSNIALNPWLSAAYGLTIFSIIGVWLIEKKIVWIITGILALSLALMVEHVSPVALLPLLLLLIAAIAVRYDQNRVRKSIWRLSVVILPLVVALGFSGAFSTWTLLDGIQLGRSTSSYTIKLNMSKPLIALILLATVVPTINCQTDISRMLKKTIPILAIGIPALAAFSSAVGYTRFDFKLQMIIFVWGIVNLFVTCIAEEVFFRGIILKELLNSFYFRNGKYLALALSSIIFGIVHFNGGPLFILVATIAGLLYGAAYIKTKTVEASILCHFGANVFHFIFLTYPKM